MGIEWDQHRILVVWSKNWFYAVQNVLIQSSEAINQMKTYREKTSTIMRRSCNQDIYYKASNCKILLKSLASCPAYGRLEASSCRRLTLLCSVYFLASLHANGV